MMDEILENRIIELLAGAFPRSDRQCNKMHEADAELVRLPGADFTLALKADSIVEEIETGLYSDPGTIGWMAVTASMSDLAAVGAQPMGIIIGESLPPRLDPSYLAAMQAGIGEACRAYDVGVFGGDTNFSDSMQITVFAMGIIQGNRLLTRVGCHAGDILYASGPMGLGGAYAFAQLTRSSKVETPPLQFKPTARIKEGLMVRGFASCCMDTSDGTLATVDQLMRLNGVGFRIELGQGSLHESAAALAKSQGFPDWMMLAGPHGDFELVFTIPPTRESKFLAAAKGIDWHPIRIGVALDSPRVECSVGEETRALPTAKIRNLFAESGGDIGKYIGALLKIAWGE
jgi:thiamine-monophosphate kinase